MRKLIGKFMLIGLVAFGAFVFYIMSPTQSAKLAVKRDLSDPESAQFRNIKNVGTHICGEVNAKNRFGGYTGYRRFAYVMEGSIGLTGNIVWEEQNSAEFSPLIVDCIKG